MVTPIIRNSISIIRENKREADALRAVVLRDGRLQVRETADPAPGQGELLLRTLSTAICAARKSAGPPRIVVHPDGDIR
nr:hypothetical protein [Mycobacterium sp. E796]